VGRRPRPQPGLPTSAPSPASVSDWSAPCPPAAVIPESAQRLSETHTHLIAAFGTGLKDKARRWRLARFTLFRSGLLPRSGRFAPTADIHAPPESERSTTRLGPVAANVSNGSGADLVSASPQQVTLAVPVEICRAEQRAKRRACAGGSPRRAHPRFS
jgi:hypothetical protein